MSNWDKDLVGVHREIAAENGSPIHVLAGPGTGKTFAMMRRVARHLEEGVTPDKILAISFTRTAARDLREQLQKLGVPGADQVRASTLHSLCFGLLGTQQAFEVTQRTPRPLLSYEEEMLVEDLAEQFGGKKNVRRLLEAYEASWARLQHEDPGHPKSSTDQEFEAALIAWLRFHKAMLLGELVHLALTFLRSNPALPVLPALDHVLVDEYQDLNKAEQTLVGELAKGKGLLVIGDDNQSIYAFRHANPEGIRTFPAENPGTKEFRIEECHRCPPNIVEVSNALIAHDPNALRRTPLKPNKEKAPADFWIVQHDSLDEEVDAVAAFIDHYVSTHPQTPPGQVLVLTPRRFIGAKIKRALIDRRRNALSYFTEDALAETSAAEGFCLLALLVDPTDRAAIRAWLGFGSDDGRRRSYERMRSYSVKERKPLPQVLDEALTGKVKVPYTDKLVQRWGELAPRLDALKGLSGLDLVRALWPPEADGADDIRLIAENIAVSKPAPTDLYEELREAITQPELPGSDGDVIQVMSLHKSKGLTREVVVIAGCMAGTLPFIDDEDPPEIQAAQLEEQRRLFYVAITRPTKVLVLSAATHLPLKDAKRENARVTQIVTRGGIEFARTSFSPFIGELGPSAPAAITTAAWRKAVGF